MELKRDRLLQGGRYRIIESIGRGGFGITYLAEQVMAKRKVCIKEFFPKDYYKRDGDTGALTLSSDGFAESMNKFKAKFVKEAQTIAALDHHNIIPIYDVFEENNTAYYVMEYIDGVSLSSIVKESGALSEDVAVGYIKQVASALAHIHEQQIMHLDVKPGNIMVRSKDDHAILIDFGLSKHYDENSGEATSTTPVGVSHGYAPIEQYKQGGVNRFSPETDIYSLGATLYYIATGIVPPHAADMGKDGIGELPSELSSGVYAAIRKSMNYWKEDRPHTIKEFLELLDNDEPIVAVIVDEEEKTKIATQQPTPKRESNEDKPKQKRSRWWLWLLILLLIGVVGYLMFKGDDKPTPISNTTNTAKPQLDTFEQIDSDSTTLNQLRQDSINMAIRDNAIRDSIARAERERFVRDSTAAAEQKKREEEARKVAQQPVLPEVAAPEENTASYEEATPAQNEGKAPVTVPKTHAPYKVGDLYNENGKEGVVFEVTADGRHGKIVSLDETKAPWDSRVKGDGYKLIIGTKTGANSLSNGKANTNKIMNLADSRYFKAFVWCRSKGGDWYLPAKDELEAILNSKKINSTLAEYGAKLGNGWYWSSTEYEDDPMFWAWYVSMGRGNTGASIKDFDGSVRAVSAF